MGIYDNIFSGTLPEWIVNVTLILWQNHFSGTVPEWIIEHHKYWEINLSDNNFSGTLPKRLGNKNDLTMLSLGRNQLTGTLPDFYQSGLTLTLSDNQFTGTLPQSYASMHNLKLSVRNNCLTGTLPDFRNLWNDKRVESLDLHGNHFSGSIPVSLCQGILWPCDISKGNSLCLPIECHSASWCKIGHSHGDEDPIIKPSPCLSTACATQERCPDCLSWPHKFCTSCHPGCVLRIMDEDGHHDCKGTGEWCAVANSSTTGSNPFVGPDSNAVTTRSNMSAHDSPPDSMFAVKPFVTISIVIVTAVSATLAVIIAAVVLWCRKTHKQANSELGLLELHNADN